MNVRAGSLGRARTLASLLAALCLLCVAHAAALDVSQAAEGGAMKFDEYGQIPHCDLTARLDNLANTLQEMPGATGYVVTYDPAKGRPGIGKRSAEWQTDYLVNSRGVAPESVVAVGAGRYQGRELKTELWVVPPGAKAPAEAAPADGEPPFTGKYAAFEMQYDASFDNSEEMPGVNPMSVTRAAFADVLKRQPDSKAYLVAFADGERAPGAWRRLASSEKLQLEELGVEAARLEIVNGGARKQSEVELWIVPKDAPPPVKPKRREKRLKEATLIGTYRHYKEIKDAGERRWMLDNLAEMLREDPQRVGCLVVFPDGAQPEFDEATGKTETPFDYAALADQWRRELAERYGIEAQRVVLLVGPAGEYAGTIETWIVPKGVALPDPAAIIAADDSDGAEKP